MVWLTGGALAVALAMIVGLLVLIVVQGGATFWPAAVVEVRLFDGGVYLGEVKEEETYFLDPDAAKLPAEIQELERAGGKSTRRLLRTENFKLTGVHSRWISDFQVQEESRPEWALVVETFNLGRLYAFPQAFLEDGKVVATEPAEVWAQYTAHHDAAVQRGHQLLQLQFYGLDAVVDEEKRAVKLQDEAQKRYGKSSPEAVAAARKVTEIQQWAKAERARVEGQIEQLKKESRRYQWRLVTVKGEPITTEPMALDEVVRAYPANQLTVAGQFGVYLSRWREFLWDLPRKANSEGGVFPAIWCTVGMTLLMSLAVVPFGVLAALYLREYAKAGVIVSTVRIAVNNLAGVPSIVFGMFGLVFFCYIIGGSLDRLFFAADLPNPTFGKGGLLWAALTLALLTLPVVIVATEEALAAVPGSMREGSYACGASKWQTIRRIVLPRAMPGILTGMILAMARGAGEVAPIMLVGAVKTAAALPVDGNFPYVHPQRSFMHLGYHIFDLGFQSPDSEASKPMVFTTTLLLITIVAVLNVTAVWLRTRLRRRFLSSAF
jgi:phosphate transport system permease protein